MSTDAAKMALIAKLAGRPVPVMMDADEPVETQLDVVAATLGDVAASLASELMTTSPSLAGVRRAVLCTLGPLWPDDRRTVAGAVAGKLAMWSVTTSSREVREARVAIAQAFLSVAIDGGRSTRAR